jgi:hypothetical protein
VKEAKLGFIIYTYFIKITENLKIAEKKAEKVFKFKSKYPVPIYF